MARTMGLRARPKSSWFSWVGAQPGSASYTRIGPDLRHERRGEPGDPFALIGSPNRSLHLRCQTAPTGIRNSDMAVTRCRGVSESPDRWRRQSNGMAEWVAILGELPFDIRARIVDVPAGESCVSLSTRLTRPTSIPSAAAISVIDWNFPSSTNCCQ